jgi:hypothetical protein
MPSLLSPKAKSLVLPLRRLWKMFGFFSRWFLTTVHFFARRPKFGLRRSHVDSLILHHDFWRLCWQSEETDFQIVHIWSLIGQNSAKYRVSGLDSRDSVSDYVRLSNNFLSRSDTRGKNSTRLDHTLIICPISRRVLPQGLWFSKGTCEQVFELAPSTVFKMKCRQPGDQDDIRMTLVRASFSCRITTFRRILSQFPRKVTV